MGARKHNHARRHKTTRTSRNTNPFRKQNMIRNAEVKAHWDRAKTVKQNYDDLGFIADTNTGKSIAQHAPGLLAEALGIKVQWVDLPEAGEIAARLEESAKNPKRADNWVSEEEVGYLQRLVEKYAKTPADLEKDRTYFLMARDIKTNWKQHTSEHLRSRIERMQKFLAAAEKAAETASKPAESEAVAAPTKGKKSAVRVAADKEESDVRDDAVGEVAEPEADVKKPKAKAKGKAKK